MSTDKEKAIVSSKDNNGGIGVEIMDPHENLSSSSPPGLKEFMESDAAVGNLKDLVGMFMSSSGKSAKWVLIFKAFCFAIIVGAIVALSLSDNFNASVAFAFGTLAGYIFGTSSD